MDDTIIAPHIHVKGAISGQSPVLVQGSVDGIIELDDTLTVAPEGLVVGDIVAKEAIIHGRVEGTVRAEQRIILTKTARVTATLATSVLRIDDGAKLKGQIEMELHGEMPKLAPSSATAQNSTTARTARTTRTSFAPTRPVTRKPDMSTVKLSPRERAAAASSSAIVPSTPHTMVTQRVANRFTATTVEQETKPAPAPAPQPPPAAKPEVKEPEQEEAKQEEAKAPAQEEAHAKNSSNKFDEFTVKELREELRRLDLPVSGTKTELIERLLEAKTS